MKKARSSATSTTAIEQLVRSYLRENPDVREVMDLVRMSEEQYLQALLAYRVPVADSPTVASTRHIGNDVHISATN